MKRTKIINILLEDFTNKEVVVKGWVKTFRNNQFIVLNDGSTIKNLQAVIDLNTIAEKTLKRITTGACIAIKGIVVVSKGKGQDYELKVNSIDIIGDADPQDYPLQPKKHSLEFLRDIAHLRIRTNTFGAIYRIRHAMIFATHHFFTKKGFYNVHTPIITSSDAEGAGEMFGVSFLNINNPPKTEDGFVDFKQDFFGTQTNLTVSGQLEVETACMGLSEVYTFGPTFRAENSNTSRHLAEFWMIEPEMAFYDINDNMDLAEELLQYLIKYTIDYCMDDLKFLNSRFEIENKQKPKNEKDELGLLERLNLVVNNEFVRITYSDAIDILKKSPPNKKRKFKFIISEWGDELQSEHERFLVEKHFKKPVIIYNYPEKIKAFYMRNNEDGKTVAAMDVLFPKLGEIVGGAQREERLDILIKKIRQKGLDEKNLSWYLDLRKFGSAPHSGFGLGFERLIQFITGMNNIRDVIPFPRYPGNAKF